ncbi:TIR domain-containing protein [Cryptosporangium japonicum]|uniref:TIR domain-containing protein n=1 Tax=Cryptosporangium japonicum TaxID=80872 RepID=A0ABN0TSX4_9ACTN
MPVTFLISAAPEDSAWVTAIAGVLDGSGLPWQRVVSSHDLALNPVLDGLGSDEFAVLVTVFSPAFFVDPHGRDLWPVADTMAGRGRLRLLPIMVAPTPLPPPLRDYQYVDLATTPFPAAIEALRATFRQVAGQTPAAPRRRVGPLRVAVTDGPYSERIQSAVRRLPGVQTARLTEPADVVLLILGRDSIVSGYPESDEFLRIAGHQAAGVTVIVPVLCDPVEWDRLPLGHAPALPRGGKPLNSWASLDDGVRSVVDGVRLICEEMFRRRAGSLVFDSVQEQERGISERVAFAGQYALDEVFKRNGTPTLTFVEPPDYARFVSALRTPGRGIVLEGPSGIGKTTLLQRAIENLDAKRRPLVLSGRRRADRPRIEKLPDGHHGTVVVDDVHRLPAAVRADLVDYLKLLADEESDDKLVLIGIPGTGESLVELAHDIATRIDVFRLPAVSDATIDEMVRKGEQALNVEFAHRAQIALAAAGSLLTAQMLCWELVAAYRIERTRAARTPIGTDVGVALAEVLKACELKYGPALRRFAAFDGPTGTGCTELLAALGGSGRTGADGVVRVERSDRSLWPGFATLAERFPSGFTDDEPDVATHLHYDPNPGYLIAEDPQLLFYLRRLSAERLYETVGKRRPRVRDQVFVSYCHADQQWLERLERHLRPFVRDRTIDVWSDRRIAAGDRWRDEISAALDQARVAILLVSSSFLASEFIAGTELPALLSAAESGGCRIIPVIVNPCLYEYVPELAEFQAVNPDGRPLTGMSEHEQDEVLVRVAASLKGA